MELIGGNFDYYIFTDCGKRKELHKPNCFRLNEELADCEKIQLPEDRAMGILYNKYGKMNKDWYMCSLCMRTDCCS